MKKLLLILSLVVLTSTAANASENVQRYGSDNFVPPPPVSKQEMAQREKRFEQRLGLTEEQKVQARNMREQGFEKMKPVIDTLKAREREADMVKNSKLAPNVQEEKLNSINNDIDNLRRQAHEIKRENMKNFESILTNDQKKILKEMKQEGRQKYHKNCPRKNINKCKENM